MVNNIGVTEKILLTTIGIPTSGILSEDITIISGELGVGFLLFDPAGTIGVITTFTDESTFTVVTYATSDTVQSVLSTTAIASDIAKGKTAYNKTGKITGTLQTITSGQQWTAPYKSAVKSYGDIRVYGNISSDTLYRAKSSVFIAISEANLVKTINRWHSSTNTGKC